MAHVTLTTDRTGARPELPTTTPVVRTLSVWCEQHNVPFQGVPVGTIKKSFTGKGNANKAAMMEAARDRGFSPADDNEADAIAILLWAIETRGGVA